MVQKKTATRKVSAARGSAADNNGPGLVDLLLRSGESELGEIDQALALIDGEIEELKKKRSSLASAGKLIHLRLHGRPPAGSGRRANQKEPRRRAIFDFLREKKESTTTEISSGTGIPVGSLNRLLNHEWFARTATGWEVATSSRSLKRTVSAGN